MNRKQNIEALVEETLASVDGISRATANPYLWVRIQQRLRPTLSVWERLVTILVQPAFALGIIFIFLLANIIVARRENAARIAVERQASEQLFAAEYNPGNHLLNEWNPNR